MTLFQRNYAGGYTPSVPHSQTSKQAAESVKPVAGQQERMVAELLRAHPDGLTDEQIYHMLIDQGKINSTVKDSSIRRARVGLLNAGAVIDSGRTSKLASGRSGTVWTWRRHAE